MIPPVKSRGTPSWPSKRGAGTLQNAEFVIFLVVFIAMTWNMMWLIVCDHCEHWLHESKTATIATGLGWLGSAIWILIYAANLANYGGMQ